MIKKKDEERQKLKEHNPLCPEDDFHHEYIFKLTTINNERFGDEWEETKQNDHLIWIRKKKE